MQTVPAQAKKRCHFMGYLLCESLKRPPCYHGIFPALPPLFVCVNILSKKFTAANISRIATVQAS